jgi:alanine racemase
MSRGPAAERLTRAFVHLDRLTRNLQMVRQQVGEDCLVWPVIKADAYGHGAALVAKHLVGAGYRTFGVADVEEAIKLEDAGVDATMIVLSATLPEHGAALVAHACEPVVCTLEMVDALAKEARAADRVLSIHLKVDTGMGRIGIRPEDLPEFLERCHAHPAIRVRGLMSHFACADEADKSFSLRQLAAFDRATAGLGGPQRIRHMANSAAIFDLPQSRLDAVRPGIALYGLRPSAAMHNPRLGDLEPVLEWKTRIVFLKRVPAGTGLSYGHSFRTERPSLIATVPAGYADGLARGLSNRIDFLVGGRRCPQVGRITMDMSLVDVTALGDRVGLGDEVVLIGRQGEEEIRADELAAKLGTINYEIVSAISHRVPRIAVES